MLNARYIDQNGEVCGFRGDRDQYEVDYFVSCILTLLQVFKAVDFDIAIEILRQQANQVNVVAKQG